MCEMHKQGVREEVEGVVASEVLEELRVFDYSQELVDDPYVENFRVAQRWGRSPSPEAPEILEWVVYEAEDGATMKVLSSISKPPLRLWCYWADTKRKESFCVTQVFKETCTSG
jgi:hypothetical protein